MRYTHTHTDNNQTNSDILNSFLPELVHMQFEVKYQLLFSSTHKQQLNFHPTHVHFTSISKTEKQ